MTEILLYLAVAAAGYFLPKLGIKLPFPPPAPAPGPTPTPAPEPGPAPSPAPLPTLPGLPGQLLGLALQLLQGLLARRLSGEAITPAEQRAVSELRQQLSLFEERK